MKRFAWIFLGLCLAVAPAARADEWSKTFTITGKPDLRVETSDANIRVDTWDRNTIEAKVTSEHWKIGDSGIKIYDHQNGDAVELEIRYPHSMVSFSFRSYRVDVEIRMPREGHVNLHTSDGYIRLSNFKGNMELNSSDGRQDIEGVDGILRARTSDGRIRATGRFDQLELGTSDGSIEATALQGSTGTADWNLHTSDGSITLQLPETFAADVDLHTGDGHINLDMPVSVQGRLGDKNIHGKLNGGGHLLTIHTGDGSITLQKT
ncbi:MAG: DUF4097 domain-containing protein [Acidobacteriia bacterium]|nr:DUF4097 domain-containing protein [Terriglobia bacterium]